MIIRNALILATLAATATLAQGEAHAGTVVKNVAARDPTPIGGTFDNWWSWLPALTPDGQVLFVVRAVDAPRILPDGSTLVSYRALFRYKDGVIEALAVPGDPIPALDNPDTPIAECWLSDFTNEKDSKGLDNVLSVSVTGASTCRRVGSRPVPLLRRGDHQSGGRWRSDSDRRHLRFIGGTGPGRWGSNINLSLQGGGRQCPEGDS